MTGRTHPLYITAALAAFPLCTLAAQPESDQQLPEMKVQGGRETSGYAAPTSNTATKIEAPLRDIPQTVNVIPEELMRDQAARSLQDALRNIPGVGLSHGDGQRDQVTIRGFSAISDQFIDGLRDDALYFRDLSNVERIDVIKGPAAVLYGRGSSGGLINRVTRKPGIDLMEVTGQIGSWQQRRGEFDLAKNFKDAGVALRVNGAIERADSYRDKQFLNREALSPSVLFSPSADTQLLVQTEFLSDRRVTDFGIPGFRGRPVAVSPSTYYGAANARDVDYTQADVAAGGFMLTHRINDDWKFRNAFRGYHYELERNNTLVAGVDEAARTATLSHSNVRRNDVGWFNQSELTQKLKLAGMEHQLLYGLEFGHQRKDQLFVSQTVGTVSLFNPVLPVVPFLANAAPSTNNVGLMDVASVYVQDLVALTSQWKALVGARYDRFEQETLERRAGAPNLSRTDNAWSPRVGLVYQPTLAQSYYVSYSKSFQPSAEGFALAANNAQLAPEKTTGYEVGTKLDFFGGLASATASLFRLERTNIKVADPTRPGVLIPVGEQRTDGLELAFTGQLPQSYQIWAGYAYLDSRVTQSTAIDFGQPVQGKRATLTPRNSANLWLTKTFMGSIGVGGGFSYVDDRAANPGNTVTLPSYVTFDAVAWYRTKSYDVQLNVYNIFDREYIVSAHGSSPNLSLPGAPRSAVLTTRFRF